MQFVRDVSFKAPAPQSAFDLRVKLAWFHIEDRSGNLPAEAVERSLVCAFRMGVQESDVVTFTGHADMFEHPARKVSLYNTDHGLEFVLVVVNHNACVANHRLWSRAMLRSDIKKRVETAKDGVILLEGVVPTSTGTPVEMHTLELTIDSNYHVVGATITFPLEVIAHFLDVLVE